MNYREKMREYLKEPNEICNHYGKWGILNKEQRDLITRLLNEMDGADNYINNLQQENARLKEERKQIKEYIEKCNFDNAEILYDFGSEYCYIDDFKEHILEILKEK